MRAVSNDSKVMSMKRLRYENGEIDAIDVRLLNALADNARVSIADLARLVRLSAPTVGERMKRLEEAGVVKGYTLDIDPRTLGLPIAAWLRIRPLPGQLPKVVDILRGLPSIVECDRITGEDCFIARAYVASVEALEKLIDHIIPFAMTNTSIIQSSPVKRRLPPIDQAVSETLNREDEVKPPKASRTRSPRAAGPPRPRAGKSRAKPA
jgi:Lrp/AsnC family transcriptional regulator, leucine-responsive regulatory protein